jgi:peptidoglycan/LPS O-acetylase OafA/YrhL
MEGAKQHYSLEKFIVQNIMLPLSIALTLFGLITEATLVKRILGSSLFVALGKASYTFYLIHVGVVYSFLNHLLPGSFLLIFVLINLLALVLWITVEEPMNRYIRSLR